MKKRKGRSALSCAVLFALLGIILLCGCPNEGADSENMRNINILSDFYPDRVRVTLNKEFGWIKPQYTPEDFPEFKFEEVEELLPGTWGVVRQQLEAERTGDWSGLQERINLGMLVDIDKFERVLILYLEEKSKENVLKAINRLVIREDVQKAEPDYFPPLELGKLPNLDTRTELQMRRDYIRTYFPNCRDVTVHNIRFDYYLGNYKGSEIVFIAWNIALATGLGGEILAWERGKKSAGGYFYNVHESELFTESDVKKLEERLNEIRRIIYE